MAEASSWTAARRLLLPGGLFGRALLILIVPLVVLQLVVAFVFVQRHVAGITHQMSATIASELNAVASLANDERVPGERRVLLWRLSRELGYELTFIPGAVIEPAAPLPWHSLAERAIVASLTDGILREISVDTRSVRKAVDVRIQLPGGVLRAMPPERRLTVSNPHFLIVWMVGGATILLTIAVIFLRNQVRPIRQLAAAAEAFGKGQPAPSFKPAGAEEVRRAAGAFLVMRARIERQIAQRTMMLSGVSHDLRTPLTRMQLSLAMLDEGPEVEELQRDVAAMNRMVEGFLAFARGDGLDVAEPVALVPLLEESAQNERALGRKVTLDLGPAASEGVTLKARPDGLRRCIANLVGNAHKYGTQTWITLTRDPRRVVISVEDDGPGIPPAMREAVFRPFFRGDVARNQDAGEGTGLGLSIALDVANAHGGSISLGDSPHGGLRAVLTLPL